MRDEAKTEQLQIRVSPREKRELSRRAEAAGMSISSWVLARALPPKQSVFAGLIEQLARADKPSFVLAEINDFLCGLSRDEVEISVDIRPSAKLSPLLRTYVAAMIEHAAASKGAPVPKWVLETEALLEPYFATKMKSLRQHLLTVSPAAFRRRNLFVDASVGDRV